MEIEFRLLGPVQVWQFGRLVGPSSPLQRALLAALLLQANRHITAERLAATLWETPPSSWRANLRTHITGLRRAIGPIGAQRLVWTAGSYLLRVLPGELDADEFHRLGAHGRSEIAAGRLAEGAALLQSALNLWQSPIADSFSWSEALYVHLSALEQDRLHTFETLTEVRLRLGEHRSLIGALQIHLADHPLREGMWGQLIRATYLAGDVAAALAVFDRARARLAEDLGIDPSRELCTLHHAMLRREDIPPAGQLWPRVR